MIRFLLLLPVFLSIFLFGSLPVDASPSSDLDQSEVPQKSGAIELPYWVKGELHDNFDIRIWPKQVVVWLEQENLRDLISDPDTPEEERAALKQVLANQLAWHTT